MDCSIFGKTYGGMSQRRDIWRWRRFGFETPPSFVLFVHASPPEVSLFLFHFHGTKIRFLQVPLIQESGCFSKQSATCSLFLGLWWFELPLRKNRFRTPLPNWNHLEPTPVKKSSCRYYFQGWGPCWDCYLIAFKADSFYLEQNGLAEMKEVSSNFRRWEFCEKRISFSHFEVIHGLLTICIFY